MGCTNSKDAVKTSKGGDPASKYRTKDSSEEIAQERRRAQWKLKELIKKEEEEETKNQANPLIILSSDQRTPEDLKIISEEKSRLVVAVQSDKQIKTLCFQPYPGNFNRNQGLKPSHFKSKPFREDEGIHLQKFEKEILSHLNQTSSFPNSVHGIVRADLGNGNYKTGTGILIGVDLVLTAAHNIYDYQGTREKYSKIEFIPGINEQEMPFGIFNVIEAFVPDEYLKTWKEDDYGLLVLDETAGTLAGYFGLHAADKELLKGKELNVFGYPACLYRKDARDVVETLSGEGRHQLWGMREKNWSFEAGGSGDFFIKYGDIHTSAGQDGGGVFYQVKGTNEYYVIGIHGCGDDSATWITKKRLNQIEKWVSQARKNYLSRQTVEEGKINIKKLNLNECALGDTGIEGLPEYAIPNIELLKLNENGITGVGAKTLSEKTNWSKLAALLLWKNSIGDDGATALSQNVPWTNLTILNLSENGIGAKGAIALSKNTSWTRLSVLDLSINDIGAKGATALSKNNTWINLATLDLSRNNIGAEGATGLSKNTSWAHLSTLNLSSNNIGAEGAAGLSKNTSWKNLTTLDLSASGLGDGGATALSKNNLWVNLTTLNLSVNEIGERGATGLSSNSSWRSLTALDLSVNKIGDKGAAGLSSNQSWGNLATLELSHNSIGAKGAVGLSSNKSWVNLTTLDLSFNDIGVEGATGLGGNSSWVNLTTLNLSSNSIGDEGTAGLAKNNSWTSLTTLTLWQNNITDKGAAELSKNVSWVSLTTLDLSANNIGDEGAAALSKNSAWGNLARLEFRENMIGAEGKIALQERWPTLKFL